MQQLCRTLLIWYLKMERVCVRARSSMLPAMVRQGWAVDREGQYSEPQADARDRERAQGRVRGPLHGIPIAVKDNIHTTNMPTTGGALAFDGFVPGYEATLVKNLRDAGAVIIPRSLLPLLPKAPALNRLCYKYHRGIE